MPNGLYKSSVWAGPRWLMMRTGHLKNGFIMTMTSLTYSQQSTAHFWMGLVGLFFNPALSIMPMFLDITVCRMWHHARLARTSKKALKSGKMLAWCSDHPLTLEAIVARWLATLNSVGQPAVMVDRVALMWWTWYSQPYHWEPPPHHTHARTDPLMDFQSKVFQRYLSKLPHWEV